MEKRIYVLPPGTVLKERWQVEELTDEEAYEAIHLGRDLRSGQAVTIKTYRPYRSGVEYANEQKRYIQEAMTVKDRVGKVPGMAAVLDCFLENDTARIVLEHVAGPTLPDHMKERGGRIPAGELLELLRPVFDALSALHAAGLVHGHVEPYRVRLAGDRACLFDFGCTPEPEVEPMTLPMIVRYFLPAEQYWTRSHSPGLGPWTDVYALSATIYYCLTGQTPASAVYRLQGIGDPPERPSALGADLPEWQEDVLMWGLELRPEARPQTMDEFVRKLFSPPEPKPVKPSFWPCLPPGTVFKDRWQVEEFMDVKYLETIYLGRDLRSEQAVTIKEYCSHEKECRPCEYANEQKRYIQKAMTVKDRVGKVPGMAAVLDCFLENDTAHIILEHVAGPTLQDHLKERGGHIPAGELLELLRPVFDALSALHAAGLVHGLVEPDNVRLAADGACLFDFGCTPEPDNDTTAPLIVRRFEAVEQRQPRGPGPWTDVYALSMTIYYCLTGQEPSNCMDRLLRDASPLQRPSALGADLPEWQEDVLMRGLEIRPRERPQTMDEFARKLFSPPPPPLSFRQRLRDLFGGGKKSEK